MKRGLMITAFLAVVCIWMGISPLTVQAEIASDYAFEGAVWEKIIEDDREGAQGVVQSICATEEYIICLENYIDDAGTPDIVKAYYRNKTDAQGNKVEQYSLAKRVADISYEHCNGMAYNPNTKEIAVSLYTNFITENRGCIYIMDSETLEYKNKIQISGDYNILGIGYDEDNDRYVIQTNSEDGYSFKILDNQFQITEDLGQYAGTAKGENFQDLCASGDYIINCPLTLNMGIGDYINMYSISKRAIVSESQMNFPFENVLVDEPEGICELEPGVFAVVVNEDRADGSRKFCVYKTMVPYNFSAAELKQTAEKEKAEKLQTNQESTEKEAQITGIEEKKDTSSVKRILKTGLIIVILGIIGFVLFTRWVSIKRERQRKLDAARRERRRIREMSGEI